MNCHCSQKLLVWLQTLCQHFMGPGAQPQPAQGIWATRQGDLHPKCAAWFTQHYFWHRFPNQALTGRFLPSRPSLHCQETDNATTIKKIVIKIRNRIINKAPLSLCFKEQFLFSSSIASFILFPAADLKELHSSRRRVVKTKQSALLWSSCFATAQKSNCLEGTTVRLHFHIFRKIILSIYCPHLYCYGMILSKINGLFTTNLYLSLPWGKPIPGAQLQPACFPARRFPMRSVGHTAMWSCVPSVLGGSGSPCTPHAARPPCTQPSPAQPRPAALSHWHTTEPAVSRYGPGRTALTEPCTNTKYFGMLFIRIYWRSSL